MPPSTESKRVTLRHFAALGVTVHSSPETSGGSEVRDALVGYVSWFPGAHFSRIRDDLELGTGGAQHHLRELEERAVLESYSDSDYRRYVVAGRFDDFERTALGYLRRETPRGMLVELLRDPTASASNLADRVGVSRPTISNYSSELEDAGLVRREDGYTVVRPETLVTLIVRHADSFGPETVRLAAEADELITYDP